MAARWIEGRWTNARRPSGSMLAAIFLSTMSLGALGCEAGAAPTRVAQVGPGEALPDSTFAALSLRVSEPSGFFDTDNLISNESGYLKVVGALGDPSLGGGAYVGVGPDQNFSYIAALHPQLAFITDVRRDNLLHHLLLKALMERAPTRVEFLAGLHGRPVPSDPDVWRSRSVDDVVAYVDGRASNAEAVADLHVEVADAVRSFGIPISEADLITIRRFHQTFIDAGLSLRFTSFGRPPRPHYPTYRQLVLETDYDGVQASYLADEERYAVVRELQLANRIIPVVGDMSGDHALREIGAVLGELGLEVTAFYTSNVEFYLWGGGRFDNWVENLASLPLAENAVIVRSYSPNSGRMHPSAVPGYYASQALQPAGVLLEGGFNSYWDVVTRGVLPLGVR
jgi:hypothetical protein